MSEKYSGIKVSLHREPETRIELRHSAQEDSDYAWYDNGKKFLATSRGFDGPFRFVAWKGGPQREVTEDEAVAIGKRRGIPEKFMRIWIDESKRGFVPFDALARITAGRKVMIERPADRMILVPESEEEEYGPYGSKYKKLPERI